MNVTPSSSASQVVVPDAARITPPATSSGSFPETVLAKTGIEQSNTKKSINIPLDKCFNKIFFTASLLLGNLSCTYWCFPEFIIAFFHSYCNHSSVLPDILCFPNKNPPTRIPNPVLLLFASSRLSRSGRADSVSVLFQYYSQFLSHFLLPCQYLSTFNNQNNSQNHKRNDDHILQDAGK